MINFEEKGFLLGIFTTVNGMPVWTLPRKVGRIVAQKMKENRENGLSTYTYEDLELVGCSKFVTP